MKALSLKGAWWWWALQHAAKDVENRDWYSSFRGRAVIHLSKNATRAEYQEFLQLHNEVQARHPELPGGIVPGYTELSRSNGHLVGVVNIAACVEHHSSPWFFGKYAFVWKLVAVFPQPIPCRGALGFWQLPEDLLAQVNAALVAPAPPPNPQLGFTFV